jgi:anti-anti-sigma factor
MGRRTWEFHQEEDEHDGVRILRLHGRLDRASAPGLRRAFADPSPGGVLVDFSALDYISGPGLAAVKDAAGRAADAARPFVVCGLEGSVHIAFELAGLLTTLTVEPDRARGLARIAGSRGA